MKCAAVTLAALAFAGLTGAAMLELSAPPVRLAAQVAANMEKSGVAHPVTAVLLNFRGYDTFLEVAVLIIALLGMRATGLPPAPPDGGGNALLPSLARLAVPLMVLAAAYLLWAGAFRPGGAFQAAAVLAAAAVLLHLAGLQAPWPADARGPRLAIAAGFLLFLAIAAVLLAMGGLLRYPPGQAGLLIVAIECGLSVSLAVNLAAFVLLRAPQARP